jgi:hypothetical protein
MQQLFAALGTDPDLASKFFGVFAGSVPVSDLFPTQTVTEKSGQRPAAWHRQV